MMAEGERRIAERAEAERKIDRELSSECAEYAEEAGTEWAYRIIRRTCLRLIFFLRAEVACRP
jgi:hypothetical protein